MKTQLYLQKAEMQLAKGLEEKALESLLTALDFQDDDIISKTQVRCFLGEYFFVHQRYTQAQDQFGWIADRAEWLEQEYDDLLNEEIHEAEVLLGIIQRFGLSEEQQSGKRWTTSDGSNELELTVNREGLLLLAKAAFGIAETIREDGFHIHLDDLYGINAEGKSILIRREERYKI